MSAEAVVADRYARALMGIVGSDVAMLDRIDDELDMLAVVLQSDSKFAAFLENPRIAQSDKKAVIVKVLGDKLSPTTLHLMQLLIDKNRENALLKIALRFSTLADEARGVEEAEVITAVPLPEDQLKRLQEKVQRFSSHQVRLRQTVDPTIMGGVVLKLGSRVIDGSVRFKLDEIRRTLQSATVH